MKIFKVLVVSVMAMVGCAHPPPPQELVQARLAFEHAERGPAATLAPAELHAAMMAIQTAERAFRHDADSKDTIDQAYIAWRRAQRAESIGVAAAAAVAKQNAEHDLTRAQTAMITNDQDLIRAQRGELRDEREATERAQQQTQDEHDARVAAEAKASDAMDALGASLALKKDDRGTIITLPGGVLFVTNRAVILPGAQPQLNMVADALKTQAEHHVIVGGHTDDQGTDRINDDLSARRANAVRDYLVAHGVSPNVVTAQGFGSHQPIGDNKSVEGRAMNRRVEIIVAPDMTTATR